MVKTPKKEKIKATKVQTPIDIFITWIGSIPSLIFHSILFAAFLVLTITQVAERTSILLIWNTIVSLEAIYLAIFIQFTVNRNTRSLQKVEEDIDEIQEDVEEMSENIDEIQENVEELSEDEDAEDKHLEAHARSLEQITGDMHRILDELDALKKK
jgi:TolA-binding protein